MFFFFAINHLIDAVFSISFFFDICRCFCFSTPPYPNFLFGNDVTIAYSAAHPPKTVGVRLTNMLREYTEEPATNETVGYLFSPDFLSDTDLGRIFQRYELSIEGEPMNGFQIEIMRPINNCQILLEGDYDGTPSLYDE
ncbi:unnamed protein product [Toxocara canis]|uniref:Uncharacterized protein n=1 Tax=Toxocara canis TaxID=6265 RepID=A0A183V085_TOXCA|nr:unnamed protein product [Toxocara canis]